MMEEIINNLKNFVEEKNILKKQISEIEFKRNELAEERNAKKACNKIENNEEIWAEVNCLGKQIADLGDQSQWFQKQLDFKLIALKEQLYLQIDSLIAEEVRKTRIITSQVEELGIYTSEMKIVVELTHQIDLTKQKIDQCLEVRKLVKNGQIGDVINLLTNKNDSSKNAKTIVAEEKQVQTVKESIQNVDETVEECNEQTIEKLEGTVNSEIEEDIVSEKLCGQNVNTEAEMPNVENIQVQETNEIEFEDAPNISELHVEEFKPEELKIEEFNLDELCVEPLTVEEFKEEATENIEETKTNVELNENVQKVEEQNETIEPIENVQNIEKQNEVAKENENVLKIEENNNAEAKEEKYSIDNEIIKALEEQIAKEQEIISFDEDDTKLFETEEETVATIKNIVVKVEEGELVYKAEISDGTSIKVYPVKEGLLKKEKIEREGWKNMLIRYSADAYVELDNSAIKKMDIAIAELFERYATKYDQDAQKVIYNYVMSFSDSGEYDASVLPPITYNLLYIGEAKISKVELKVIQKNIKNASKNSVVEIVGNTKKIGKIKYFIRKIFKYNTPKALPVVED